MQKNNLPISIVMPVHNGERYIYEAVDSILNQNFEDFELIIVNDASTDSTLTILESYKQNDSRIVIITLEKQASLADVLNEGLQRAKGKYIVRMDADDIMYPDRLFNQYKFMEEHSNVVVAGGQVDLIDENGSHFSERLYPTDSSSLKKNLFLFSPFAHPAVIIRRSSLIEVNGYDEGLQKVEDIMLWFRLAHKGEFANVNKKVLKYRVREDSESLGNVYDHFIRTYSIRKKVIKEKIYKIDLRQRIVLEIQYIIVSLMKYLPRKWFMYVFEIGRKIFS